MFTTVEGVHKTIVDDFDESSISPFGNKISCEGLESDSSGNWSSTCPQMS